MHNRNSNRQFMNRDTMNVEHEIYDCTGNNWDCWNSNNMFKEKFGSHTRNTFSRLTTKTTILGTSHTV